MVSVVILRLGHRPQRDQRVTTHVGLTARALGAEGMYLAGKDQSVVASISDVVSRWGGAFFVTDGVSWRRCINSWKDSGGRVVHLTMYGEPLPVMEETIRRLDRVLLVVGAEKVPGDLFGIADYNVAVTSQPHSEIASLAVFLDRIFQGEEFSREFPGGTIRVVPSRAGKIAEET
ncbi:MAG: tRNA (cytidine(56)-2'-O)-methyltransferase [Methanomicrobiales archaeon]|jgi:tRNA (cytidine56-2'-O)-methyltransferase|nr:tRNA (cytidine(56)-2'-O)-methyltransferase [Methanomicrobiales archaeon]